MTALTTILALTTMALGIGEGAEMMQPMAVTSIGGLIYATMLTLVIVPIMYYIITKYTSTVLGVLSTVVIAGATVAAVMVLGYFWTIYIAVPLVIIIILLLIFLPKKGAEVVE
jgi:HAE1 family hydrophobic/amphiphilic exporter-1